MAHFPPGQGKPIGFYAVKAALHFISFQFEVLCGAPFAYATFIFYTHFLFLAAAANYAGKLLYYAPGVLDFSEWLPFLQAILRNSPPRRRLGVALLNLSSAITKMSPPTPS